ncbi:MAG: SPOR domain-containing protein, partial [Sphingopyxis sp.]
RAQAADARARAQADARARVAEETAARERAAAEAEARAEAEQRRRNPARTWVQVATGANVTALAFDCRRLARAHPASFEGQSCSSAAWNRTRRLVVGPFRTAAVAREWLGAYTRAGGDGFIWQSEAGEDVAAVARR